MSNSIFTQIIEGKIPCHKVYEDENIIAFLDINPLNPGHILVVPKQEIDQIWDLPEDLYNRIMKVCKQIALKQRKVLSSPRVGTMIEGFEIPHAHVHVVPMYKGIRATILEHKLSEPDHEELAKMAKILEIKERI